MKNNKIQLPVVDVDTGEYMILIKTKKESKINNNKFIKFYLSFIAIIDQLTKSEIIIIKYIALNIQIKKTKILLTMELTNLNKSNFYKSINNLIKLNVIIKTKYQNIYEVNSNMLYNGRY